MLAEAREMLIEEIRDNLSVVAMDYPVAEAGAVYEELAAQLQALGISNLLLYADAERLFENLIRSGHTRRAFLRKCAKEGERPSYLLAASRVESFFDCVAADDLDLAREIARLSPPDWVPNGEYEDDYCHFAFFHEWIEGEGADRAKLQAVLDRFERALEGADSARLDLCRAFLERDEILFRKAFDRLLLEREEKIEAVSKTAHADDPGFAARAAVFVEGLAILRLAEPLGFSLDPEYHFCPSLARVSRRSPPLDDIYPEIEREMAELRS